MNTHLRSLVVSFGTLGITHFLYSAPTSAFTLSELETTNNQLLNSVQNLSTLSRQSAAASTPYVNTSSPDAALNLYSSSFINIKRYDAATGSPLDDFTTGSASVNNLAYREADNSFYVIDTGRSNILKYDSSGTFVNFVTGSDFGVNLVNPTGITFSPTSGNLFVVDNGSSDPGSLSGVVPGDIREFDPVSGSLLNTLTNGSTPFSPFEAAFNNGTLYVSDGASNSILRYDSVTGLFDTFASGGGLSGPAGLAFGGTGNDLYVVSALTNAVIRYDDVTGAPIGNSPFVTYNSPFTQTALTDLAFGPDGNLYVSNTLGNDILRFDGSTGSFIDEFVAPQSGSIAAPQGFIFAPALVPEPVVSGLLPLLGALGLSAGWTQWRRRRVGGE